MQLGIIIVMNSFRLKRDVRDYKQELKKTNGFEMHRYANAQTFDETAAAAAALVLILCIERVDRTMPV